MAHDVETIVLARDPAWHGLGIVVPDLMTASEVCDLDARLSSEVDLLPLFARAGDGSEIECPERYATVRRVDRRPLGVGLSGDYRVLQARRAFALMDDLVDSGEAKYEVVGTLAEGRQAWMLCRLPREIRVGGLASEEVRPRVLLVNSFDGSAALTWKLTTERVVCRNTLRLALSGRGASFAIRHSESMEGRIEEARRALSLSFAYLDAFEREATQLLEREIADDAFDRFLAELVPAPEQAGAAKRANALNTQSIIRDLYQSEPDLTHLRGSCWGALQAVSAYVDHRIPNRGAESRFRRVILGEGDAGRLTERAHELLRR
jgi:phage/plasmid-like protein (TIGR03299 family)